MAINKCRPFVTVPFCLSFCLFPFDNSYTTDGRFTPEQVVAQHLKSLGTSDALGTIRTRTAVGTVRYRVVRGPSGQAAGQAQWASEKGKTAFVMRFNDVEYPGEHFAYEGRDVSIAETRPQRRSYLGASLLSHDGLIIKNGLMGGVLSMDWPLLDLRASKARFSYRRRKVDGRELHELDYDLPKPLAMRNRGIVAEIKMYFELDTFRHVMTKYRFSSEIYGYHSFEILQKFENFKEVDGITLPFKYDIHYSDSQYAFAYSLDFNQVSHNLKVNPEFYRTL